MAHLGRAGKDVTVSEPSPEVIAALALSSLAGLPTDVLSRLMESATQHDVSAGATVHRPGEPPFWELVVQGLLRTHVGVPSGRTMTIRYFRPGALMGTGTLFNRTERVGRGTVTSVTESRLLRFQPVVAQALAERDIRFTNALLAETSARIGDYINELEASSMTSIRQRLARHLLDLAADSQAGSELEVRASQEELAAAIGTVREMVARILRDMRDDGLVRTERRMVRIVDAAALADDAFGGRL